MPKPTKRIWFGRHAYFAEHFAEPTQHPEYDGKYHQTTFLGPDKRTLTLFKRMLNEKGTRGFEAEGLHFSYRGDIEVIEISNSRVIVVRIFNYHPLTTPK